MRILVTGAAGFIGYHLCKRLLDADHIVYGMDNLNDYYDRTKRPLFRLKTARLSRLSSYSNFIFRRYDITNREDVALWFHNYSPDIVVNLAAEVGVRNSLENPQDYIDTNISGFLNILEGCRRSNVKHLFYASSSSVYGDNEDIPFRENHKTEQPLSFYGATKKANELMAYTYSHVYNLCTTGLRFFTVYGPWGRPDMSYFLFTKAILEGQPIKVFNEGNMSRDFTYIDDIVNGIYQLIISKSHTTKHSIYNIGNNKTVKLDYFINLIERGLGKKAIKELMPMQAGDVKTTYSDITKISKMSGFKPFTSIEVGIPLFLKWYKDFYTV